jgi:tripartite-type tricarboxylate transporter receptor subunit TctC
MTVSPDLFEPGSLLQPRAIAHDPRIMARMKFVFWILLAASVATLTVERALAQSYPTKPIRLLVGFPPGGSTDIVARVVGQKLGETLGTQIIIDNRPGASATIAMQACARAAPDGYTLVVGHLGTLAVNPAIFPKLSYDPIRDFAPVSLIAVVPAMLAVHPSLPAKSVKELIALAKARPGQLNYGSSGAGGTPHLAVEYFKLMAGVDIVHVPYKGAGPMTADLVGGQISLTITGIPALMPHVKSARLRALAVSTSKRLPIFPELPTIAETLPGYEATTWYGVLAPAGTPKDLIARLHDAIARSVKQPDVADRLAGEGAEPVSNTPEAFAAYIKSELARWEKIVKRAGITAG